MSFKIYTTYILTSKFNIIECISRLIKVTIRCDLSFSSSTPARAESSFIAQSSLGVKSATTKMEGSMSLRNSRPHGVHNPEWHSVNISCTVDWASKAIIVTSVGEFRTTQVRQMFLFRMVEQPCKVRSDTKGMSGASSPKTTAHCPLVWYRIPFLVPRPDSTEHAAHPASFIHSDLLPCFSATGKQ